MDKSAIFVDVGYLMIRGSLVACGTKQRGAVDCAYEPLVKALFETVEGHSGLKTLRLYWYDAARGRVPSSDHLEIGNLPYVKVRLGRVAQSGRQKGVDALIYRDLMTLAREKAMSRAYLLAGDEDLREAVLNVQDLGIQVVVVGVGDADSPGIQSRDLVQEADEQILLGAEFLGQFFTERKGVRQLEIGRDVLFATGHQLGEQWADKATYAEIRALIDEPRLPRSIDIQILKDASRALNISRIRDQWIPDLRTAFKAGVTNAAEKAGAQAPGQATDPSPQEPDPVADAEHQPDRPVDADQPSPPADADLD
jgi:hypothetical protein